MIAAESFYSSTEAVAQRCFVKKLLLQVLQNFPKNTCTRVSFLKKSFFKKEESLVQMFSCEFC